MLLFVFTFQYYSTMNIHNTIGANRALKDPDIGMITQYLMFDSMEDKNVFIDKLVQFAKEQKIDLEVSLDDVNENFIEINKNYIYSHQPMQIKNTFLEQENYDLDFTKNQERFYSNSLNDQNAFDHFAYISRFYKMNSSKKIYRYYPFEQLKNQDVNSFGVIILTHDVNVCIEQLKNSDLSSYYDFERLMIHYGKDENVLLPDHSGQIQMLTVLLGVSLILVILQIFYSKKNAIAIRKLYGENANHISRDFFSTIFVINAGIYYLIQCILYMVFCGQFGEVTHDLIKMLFKEMFLFVAVCLLLYGLSYIFVKKVNTLHALNMKKRKLKEFSIMNAVLKCCMLILISSGVFQITPNLMKSAQVLWNYSHRFSDMKDNMQLHTRHANDYDQMKAMQRIYEIGNRHGALLERIKQPNVNEELDEKNFYQHTVFMTNKNYLHKYEFIDENGDKIQLEQYENEEICLIPMHIKEKMNIFYGYHLPSIKIYYNNQVVLYTDTYPALTMYEKNPIIHIPNEVEGNEINSNTFVVPKEQYEAFMQDLKKEGLDENVSFVKVDHVLKENMSGMWISFLQNLMIFLLLFTCFYCVIRQGFIIYLNSFTKVISIRYLYGWNFVKRYKEYFIYHALVYGVIVLVLLYMKMGIVDTLRYVSVFVCLDLLMMLIKVLRMQKTMIKRCLKGDEWK